MLNFSFVLGSDLFFAYYEDDVFSAFRQVENRINIVEDDFEVFDLVLTENDLETFSGQQIRQQFIFSPFRNLFLDGFQKEEEETEDKEEEKEIIEIEIFEDGFTPDKIEISLNQEVLWINKRAKVKALVMGLREIDDMRSGFLRPGDSFSYIFTNRGEFIYADAVMIGMIGKVNVGWD